MGKPFCHVSVPLRGLKEMKAGNFEWEKRYRRVSVPLRGLKEMKVLPWRDLVDSVAFQSPCGD